MPLALSVCLLVTLGVIVVGVLGFLIDKSAEHDERKWEH
jgi:hypothetical protein